MDIKDSRVIIPDEIVLQQVENESVVINLLTEKYFGLDEIGTQIWIAITSTSSIQEAIEELLSDYEVGQNHLEQDVFELAQKLKEFGLISLIPASK